jgi:hypothetical protein
VLLEIMCKDRSLNFIILYLCFMLTSLYWGEHLKDSRNRKFYLECNVIDSNLITLK